jgi:hypothetical protein
VARPALQHTHQECAGCYDSLLSMPAHESYGQAGSELWGLLSGRCPQGLPAFTPLLSRV